MAELTYNETAICNLALAGIGATRINDIDTDTSLSAIQCRLHYYHRRNALQRAHSWRFNGARAQLGADATWDPDNNDQDFEWEYKYALPANFMALRAIYSSTGDKRNRSTGHHEISGQHIYSDENPMQIKYSQKVTDPTKFDPLFIEVLRLSMELDLMHALAKTGSSGMYEMKTRELEVLMRKVRAMDRKEQELLGRDAQLTWIDSRNIRSTGRNLKGIA